MAVTCGRVAKISDMESSVAAAKNDATLWETEEQALRYLLEDGKLNLCLRNMIAYKAHQRAGISSHDLPTVRCCPLRAAFYCVALYSACLCGVYE